MVGTGSVGGLLAGFTIAFLLIAQVPRVVSFKLKRLHPDVAATSQSRRPYATQPLAAATAQYGKQSGDATAIKLYAI